MKNDCKQIKDSIKFQQFVSDELKKHPFDQPGNKESDILIEKYFKMEQLSSKVKKQINSEKFSKAIEQTLIDVEFHNKQSIMKLSIDKYNQFLVNLSSKVVDYIPVANKFILDVFDIGLFIINNNSNSENNSKEIQNFYKSFIQYTQKIVCIDDCDENVYEAAKSKCKGFFEIMFENKICSNDNDFFAFLDILNEEIQRPTELLMFYFEVFSNSNYTKKFIKEIKTLDPFEKQIEQFFKANEGFNDNVLLLDEYGGKGKQHKILGSLYSIVLELSSHYFEKCVTNILSNYNGKNFIYELYELSVEKVKQNDFAIDFVSKTEKMLEILMKINKLTLLQSFLFPKEICLITGKILQDKFWKDENHRFSNDRIPIEFFFNKPFLQLFINNYKSAFWSRKDLDKSNLIKELIFYAFVGMSEEVNIDVNNIEIKINKIIESYTRKDRKIEELEALNIALQKTIGVGTIDMRLESIKNFFECDFKFSENIIVQDIMKKSYEHVKDKDLNAQKDFYARLARLNMLQRFKEINAISEDEYIEKLSSNTNFKLYAGKSKESSVLENISISFYLSNNVISSRQEENDLFAFTINVFFEIFSHYTKKLSWDLLIQDPSQYIVIFKYLYRSVKELNKFFVEAKKNYDNYREFFVKIEKHIMDCIIEGLGVCKDNLEQESPRHRYKVIKSIICNFRNDKMLEHIFTILKSQPSEESRIDTIFKEQLKRNEKDTLLTWENNAIKILNEEIFRLYCIYKYPESYFNKCFQDSNPNKQIPPEETREVKIYFEVNLKKFQDIGFNYLQHNQVGALALINQEIKTKSSFVIRCGTGQGKSLLIVETARKIFDNDKSTRIWIFTCYDDLAERDHNKFQPYYESCGIASTWIAPGYGSKAEDLENIQKYNIIYTDLTTYFEYLEKAGLLALNGHVGSDFKNLYPTEKDVIICDEFDSLIFDIVEDNFTPSNYQNRQAAHTHTFNHLLIKKADNNLGTQFKDNKEEIQKKIEYLLNEIDFPLENLKQAFPGILDNWLNNINLTDCIKSICNSLGQSLETTKNQLALFNEGKMDPSSSL